MTIYERIASERVAQLIAKGRAAAQADDFSSNGNAVKAVAGQIHENLWQCMGSLPICTAGELRDAIQTCLVSPQLRDDRAVEWLTQHLAALCGRSMFPRCELRVMDGWRNSTGLGEGRRWALEVAGVNECTWYIEMVEKSWPWGGFTDASFFSMLIGAKGVSQSEFARLTAEVTDVVHTVVGILDDTSETLIDENRGEAPESYDDIITQSLRLHEEDDETTRRCLELWLQPPTKSDQLQRRLRNAIGLMTEAMKASHAAVSLSLWCAAIEAMVVKKGSEAGLSEAFAANTTTLLQPAAELRLAAMKEVKMLYAARSDLIHGNTVDGDPQLERIAKRLAAGVFRAMMQWMREHDTIDQMASADDAFFDALRVADKTGRAMEGVSMVLESCLPGHSERGRG